MLSGSDGQPTTARDAHAGQPPLGGVRVLEYAQYVAGPFAGMLLADLGADVVKVEPPAGDAWRRYEPFADGESRHFYALNRNKRSVVIDLKTDRGRRESERLIATADAVVHNFPAARALRFGVDRERVRELNPRAVWCSVSALGSDGPDAGLTAFDLIAQALGGLLLADVRAGDQVPRRAGGIAMADFTAGLLAAIAVLGGLVRAQRAPEAAPGIEVSLLGAALAVQAQRFVSVEPIDRAAREDRLAAPRPRTAADLAAHAERIAAADGLEPYYRSYRATDGFFALSCLNPDQRRAMLAVLAAEDPVLAHDPHLANPQAVPADEAERARRLALVQRVEHAFARGTVAEWVGRLRAAGVPAAAVRSLDELFDDPQALANGLVASLPVPGVGTVRQLGALFKVDGRPAGNGRRAPALGEHTAELLRGGEVALR
jgi:crotonobetainyl-CoA:carnitine CoA-transferase CaiB-like acyl-CoA transferase